MRVFNAQTRNQGSISKSKTSNFSAIRGASEVSTRVQSDRAVGQRMSATFHRKANIAFVVFAYAACHGIVGHILCRGPFIIL